VAHGGRDLGGEVGLFLLDPLAKCEANEAGDLAGAPISFSASFSACSTVTSGLMHERLLEEDDFLEELAHAAFHHLLDDVFRLAGLARLVGIDRLLALTAAGSTSSADSASGLVAATCMATWRAKARAASALPSVSMATSTPILPRLSATALWT
jgi:hypothetical protein